MNYVYRTLDEDTRNEMLVQTLMAQESDLYMHTINLERFEALAKDESTPAELKERVTNEIPVLKSRIAEVEGIIKHLEPQLPDQKTIEQTALRIKARENLSAKE